MQKEQRRTSASGESFISTKSRIKTLRQDEQRAAEQNVGVAARSFDWSLKKKKKGELLWLQPTSLTLSSGTSSDWKRWIKTRGIEKKKELNTERKSVSVCVFALVSFIIKEQQGVSPLTFDLAGLQVGHCVLLKVQRKQRRRTTAELWFQFSGNEESQLEKKEETQEQFLIEVKSDIKNA